ncbi:zinc finger BED domain-containing protein RICESLEEPER 3 [Tanacetum coccineum]
MASESASTTTGVGSTSALTIREIIPTNRTPEVWKDFNMCIMTNGAAESESGSGANVDGRDGQIFMYNPDYLREQFAGLVIQRGFHSTLDHEQNKRGVPEHYATKIHSSKENQFPVLSRMAMDILSVQASSVASESAFSTSGRLLTIRRTRLTPESLEMCMCLKDHLDAQERKQDTSPLELPLDVEEGVFNVEVQQNEATQLTDQEIALDASSDGSSGEPRHDYIEQRSRR